MQEGYRSKISSVDAGYFSISRRDKRIGLARSPRSAPTIEQLEAVLNKMPRSTFRERRDAAMVACLVLTGVRVSAFISLKLKHCRRDGSGIDQPAEEVWTKAGKSHTVYFFPVSNTASEIFRAYVAELRSDKLWGESDPLFPASERTFGRLPEGITRSHWKTPEPVREALRRAFALAGLPYYGPHSFRNMLAQEGERRCGDPEVLKAWSENLSHDDVLTTLRCYGSVPELRRAELMRLSPVNPTHAAQDRDALELLDAVRERILKGKL